MNLLGTNKLYAMFRKLNIRFELWCGYRCNELDLDVSIRRHKAQLKGMALGEYIRQSGGVCKAASAGLLELDQDALDLVARMLVYDPDERITASDALQHAYFR